MTDPEKAIILAKCTPKLVQGQDGVPDPVCRICHTNSAVERLISPCHCRGSLAFVHLSCLERWLNQSSRSYCELCLYQYNAIETQRYKLCEGLKLWIRHPRNRNHVRSDIILGILLTLVTVGLIIICCSGLDYFLMECYKLGIPRHWLSGAVAFFMSLVCLGYFITMYFLLKDQLLPWYNWWKNTVDVRLMLNSCDIAKNQVLQV